MTWSESFHSWLIYSALASLAVLAVGAIAALLPRQPMRRLRIIELSLVGCLAVALLGLIPSYPRLAVDWLPDWPTEPHAVVASPSEPMDSFVEPEAGPAVEIVSEPAAEPARPSVAEAAEPAGLAEPVRPASWSWSYGEWMVAIYLAGVGLGVLWWFIGIWSLLPVLRSARPAPARCRRLLVEIAGRAGNGPRLLVSRLARQPFVSALWPTTIVLPEDVCEDEQAARWALAHEWSHVERRDFSAWYAADLAKVLFFYHPLVWWLRRRLRLYQDFAADARASRQAARAEDYAEFLAHRAAAGSLHPAMVGLGMGFRKSELYRRVVMLVQDSPMEIRVPRVWTALVSLAALVLIGVVPALSSAPDGATKDSSNTSREKIVVEPGGQEPSPNQEKSVEPAGGLKKVDFVIGPHQFAKGDKIVVKEVWSELGTLAVGDTVTVRGTYTLASQSKAQLGFYLTVDANNLSRPHDDEQTMLVREGTGGFEMKRQIRDEGHLHLGFYMTEPSPGYDFGNLYFGTEAQMAEIAHWDLEKWTKRERSTPSLNDEYGRPNLVVEQLVSAASGQYVAHFSGGPRVELLGVADSPSQGKPWWLPDGSPKAERPYDGPLDGGMSYHGKGDYVSREIAVRMEPMPSEGVGLTWEFVPACSGGVRKPISSGTADYSDMKVFEIMTPADAKSVSFRLGVADGPWEPLGECEASRPSTSTTLDGTAEIAFFSPYEKDGKVVVPIAHGVSGRDLRVLALGKDGREYASGLSQVGGGKINKITAVFSGVSLKDVKVFRLQSRPYRWVEFRDIAIRPKQKVADRSPAANPSATVQHGDNFDLEIKRQQTRWHEFDLEIKHLQSNWHPEKGNAERDARIEAYKTFIAANENDPRVAKVMISFASQLESSLPGYYEGQPKEAMKWYRKAAAKATPGSAVWKEAMFLVAYRVKWYSAKEAKQLLEDIVAHAKDDPAATIKAELALLSLALEAEGQIDEKLSYADVHCRNVLQWGEPSKVSKDPRVVASVAEDMIAAAAIMTHAYATAPWPRERRAGMIEALMHNYPYPYHAVNHATGNLRMVERVKSMMGQPVLARGAIGEELTPDAFLELPTASAADFRVGLSLEDDAKAEVTISLDRNKKSEKILKKTEPGVVGLDLSAIGNGKHLIYFQCAGYAPQWVRVRIVDGRIENDQIRVKLYRERYVVLRCAFNTRGGRNLEGEDVEVQRLALPHWAAPQYFRLDWQIWQKTDGAALFGDVPYLEFHRYATGFGFVQATPGVSYEDMTEAPEKGYRCDNMKAEKGLTLYCRVNGNRDQGLGYGKIFVEDVTEAPPKDALVVQAFSADE